MNENKMIVINENGIKESIVILKYFKYENDNRKYIIYINPKNNLTRYKIFASEIIENDSEIIIKEIEDPSILNNIKEIIKENKEKWVK